MGKTVDSKFRQLLQKGGAIDPAQGLEALEAAAKERGLSWCVSDCEKARSWSAVFRAVVKAVDYPQFIGGSFDALYDCLNDSLLDQKDGLVLILDKLHSADPAIVNEGKDFIQILNDSVQFAQENGRVFIYAIHHAGKHPDAIPGKVNNWSDEPA